MYFPNNRASELLVELSEEHQEIVAGGTASPVDTYPVESYREQNIYQYSRECKGEECTEKCSGEGCKGNRPSNPIFNKPRFRFNFLLNRISLKDPKAF